MIKKINIVLVFICVLNGWLCSLNLVSSETAFYMIVYNGIVLSCNLIYGVVISAIDYIGIKNIENELKKDGYDISKLK